MKNKIFLITIILVSIMMSTSCKKESNTLIDDHGHNSSSTPAIITSGSWYVSYYHESGNDHTSNFSGYTFTFGSNGTITATISGVTTTGTWTNDDSNHEFHINIGTTSPLTDIDNGWLIISKTSTEFDLKDDNTAHNEELHFTKL